MNDGYTVNIDPEGPNKAVILSFRRPVGQLYAVDVDSMDLAGALENQGRAERRPDVAVIQVGMCRNDGINRARVGFKADSSVKGSRLERIDQQPGSIGG